MAASLYISSTLLTGSSTGILCCINAPETRLCGHLLTLTRACGQGLELKVETLARPWSALHRHRVASDVFHLLLQFWSVSCLKPAMSSVELFMLSIDTNNIQRSRCWYKHHLSACGFSRVLWVCTVLLVIVIAWVGQYQFMCNQSGHDW